jgi:hypothetical protein
MLTRENVMLKILFLSVLAWALAAPSLVQSSPPAADSGSVIVAQGKFKEFKPMPGEQVIRGQILKIDKDAFLIKDTDGKEVRLKITEQTIVRAEFKPGDRIQAHVDEAGVVTVIKYMTEKMEGQQTPGAKLPPDTKAPQAAAIPRPDQTEEPQLLPGHRVVKGTVEEVKGDMARVNLGDLKTRPLSLKQGQEKGIESLKEGDRVEIVINSENGVVDYHREGQPHQHRILRGRVAEVAEGIEWALIIEESGKKERYAVQPEARSRIKKVYTGAPAVFLIGEANNILDAVAENNPEIQLPIKELDKKSSETGQQLPR